MPRIAGVDIPDNKPVWIALRYIYGIGPRFSRNICGELDIADSVRAKDLTEDQLSQIGTILSRDYLVEGQLRRQRQEAIARLRSVNCYRGKDTAGVFQCGAREPRQMHVQEKAPRKRWPERNP